MESEASVDLHLSLDFLFQLILIISSRWLRTFVDTRLATNILRYPIMELWASDRSIQRLFLPETFMRYRFIEAAYFSTSANNISVRCGLRLNWTI